MSLVAALAAQSFPAFASDLPSTDPPVTVAVRDGALASAVDSDFRQALAQGTSGAVIVESGDKLVLKGGYGWANREAKQPFTSQTIAQIGSITKQFTAMAIIDLWHEGKLEFSKPVKTYLPQTAEPAASVTLDELLAHTSGMPDECGDDFDRVSEAQFLTKCATTPLAFRPGSQFRYSNAEYTLLGMIVERVSGKSLETYLRDRFFKPFGMNDTGYEFADVPRSRFAIGYSAGKPQPPIDQNIAALHGDYWNLKGNGGMQSTLDDMDRWYPALSGPQDLPAAMRTTALTPKFKRTDQPDLWEGYGWAIRTDADNTVAQISHSGSDGVFFSYFCWRPKDRIFWYLVGNAGDTPTTELVKTILKTVKDSRPSAASPSHANGPPSKN
jgi:CubicO group peptidase (beta-lactamase class C family)